jgi:hypothetical protein
LTRLEGRAHPDRHELQRPAFPLELLGTAESGREPMRDRVSRASKKIRGRRRAPERTPVDGATASAGQFASPACLLHEFVLDPLDPLEAREASATTTGSDGSLHRRGGRSMKRTF